MNRPLLSFDNISKTIKNRSILKKVTLDVFPGEVCGLLGPNGAGKTSAFYLTIGIGQPTSGALYFKGVNITTLPIHKRAALGIGYLSQEPTVFGELTVLENLELALEMSSLSKQQRKEKANHLLEDLQLTKHLDKPAAVLSGGERRRLEIARVLALDPQLLLLDEPFANVDPITIQTCKSLVRDLVKKGLSILITDHNARELLDLTTRCYVLIAGEVMAEGTPNELYQNQIVKERYLGTDFKI